MKYISKVYSKKEKKWTNPQKDMINSFPFNYNSRIIIIKKWTNRKKDMINSFFFNYNSRIIQEYCRLKSAGKWEHSAWPEKPTFLHLKKKRECMHCVHYMHAIRNTLPQYMAEFMGSKPFQASMFLSFSLFFFVCLFVCFFFWFCFVLFCFFLFFCFFLPFFPPFVVLVLAEDWYPCSVFQRMLG